MIRRFVTAICFLQISFSLLAHGAWALNDTIRTEGISMDSLRVEMDSLYTETLLQRADSLIVKADTLNVLADSLAISADSLAISADSLAISADSLAVPADSLALRTDSLQLGMDSLRADTLLQRKDTLVASVDPILEARRKQMELWNQRRAKIMKAFADSLGNLRKDYLDYISKCENEGLSFPKKYRVSSEYYRLFVPPTFYISPAEQAYGFDWKPGKKLCMTPCDSVYTSRPEEKTRFELPDMERIKKVDRWVNRVLLKYYMEHPDRVVGNELDFIGAKALDDVQKGNQPRKEDMKKLMSVENPVESANAEVNMVIMKPNFWKYDGNGKVQFTQHGVSDNWYTGGENTNALYSELILTANYDNRQGIQLENKLEMKLGFITAPSDTLHSFKTNSDMIRFSSKFGVRAFKNVYYTLETEVKTQFLPNYNTNSNDMVSNFLSPLQIKLKLGLDYKYSRKNLSLSIFGAPLTYKHVYLKNDRIVNPSSFEVKNGERTANLYGSELTGKLDWKLSKNITWKSKLDYFTTYEKVVISWENTFDFQLSRYLSTTLFIHPRFDDGVTLSDTNRSYFQFKEMLTFGFSYSW